MDAANNANPHAQTDRPHWTSRLPNFQFRSGTYLLMLAWLFFLMSGNTTDPRAEHRLEQAIDQRLAQRNRFRDWIYHNATEWHPPDKGNETQPIPSWNQTFELEDWSNTSVEHELANLNLEQPDQPHWRNLTGFLKGEWEWLNVSLEGNETLWNEHRGSVDWQKGGKFEWNARENFRPDQEKHKRRKEEKEEQRTTFLRGTLELKAESDRVNLDLDALHFAQGGSLYSFLVPETEPLDFRQITALVPDSLRNLTAHTILGELGQRITRMKELLSSHSAPSAETVDTPPMNCSFAFWSQLQPLPEGTTQEQVDEYEKELQQNSGRDVAHLPRPSINGIAYSQNCGLVLRVKNTSILPMDQFWWKTLSYSAFMAVVGFTLTVLTVRQMESTSTPNSIARVSYWTISMQGGMDSYSFVTHLTLASVVDARASYALLLPAFAAALSGLLFGLRYAASIRVATTPSTTAPPPPPQPQPPTPAERASRAALNRSESGSQPEDVDAAPQPQPRVQSAWEYFWRPDSPAWLFLFVSVVSLVLYGIISIGIVPCIVTALYSYWIPQIYLNAFRGSARRSLKLEYMLGTTACRLALPLYVWGCPANVLFTNTTNWVWVLCAYQVLQTSVLLLQQVLGARFFVRESWGLFPEIEYWDYHPITPPADIESGGNQVDCIICLEPIELRHGPAVHGHGEDETAEEDVEHERDPLLDKTRESLDPGRLFGRFSYMVPPCHHIAHTRCLEQWLAMKSECPLCRRHLPNPS